MGDLKRPLMCESSTPTPPLTRTRHFPPVTESMRRRKNEPMNRGYTRGGAFVFCSTCFLGHRRSGERGNPFLQATGLHACSEVGSSILHHTLVAKVSSDFFPHPFSHPSPTRSKILSRPSRPPPSSHRPCHPILHQIRNLFVSPKFPFGFVYTLSPTLHFSLFFVPLYHMQCMCV